VCYLIVQVKKYHLQDICNIFLICLHCKLQFFFFKNLSSCLNNEENHAETLARIKTGFKRYWLKSAEILEQFR